MSLTNRQYLSLVLTKNSTLGVTIQTSTSFLAQGLTNKVNSLTVISLGGGTLSVRLNSKTNSRINLSDNMKIEGTPITELYWLTSSLAVTSNVAVKNAQIYVVWID